MGQNVRVHRNQRVLLTIKRLGINGEGVAYYKRKICFVPGALPGEQVIAAITAVHPRYLEGRLVEIKRSSADRVTPKDPYPVGGIELEHLAYPAQLRFKRDLIKQALAKFKPAGYADYDVRPTIGMTTPYAYRNKAQFQVRRGPNGKLIAGLYRRGSHRLVDLPTFSTQTPATMKVMRTVLAAIEELGIAPYDERHHTGVVRTIVVREAFATHELQVVLITRTRVLPQATVLAQTIMQRCPQVVSVMHNVNPEKTSLVWGDQTTLVAGKPTITERLGDVTFDLSARAFFQLNPHQTLKLYSEVGKALDLQLGEVLCDAYCGVGTISLFVAGPDQEVRGMDVIPAAIADANENARRSGRKHAHYEVGKAEDLFPQWAQAGFAPDALVVDPPRTGLDAQLIKTILQARPQKMVYVSCNPATLARDLVPLTMAYHVDYIQSVDMFPQTARCEAVVKLSLR